MTRNEHDMSREEAIDLLDNLIGMVDDNHDSDYDTALKMAIKALEFIDKIEPMFGDMLDIPKELKQEPSGDLISREELLKAIDTWDRFGVDDTNSLFHLDNLSLPHYVAYIHYDDVIKCIKGIPSVKLQEPKTGHWEWVQYDYNPKLGNWHCSECRCIVVECVDKEEKGGIPLYKYCPQCGAKMQETEIEG